MNDKEILVGEPCDYGGLEVIPDYIGKEFVIFTMPTGFEQCDNIIKFKPIKSHAEIEREELTSIIYCGGRLASADLAKMIIDAGWSKQPVKPLSRYDFKLLYFDENADSLYELIKPYIIQGGDK